MPSRTWIDVASDWVSNLGLTQSMDFSPEQLQLLEDLFKAGLAGTGKVIAQHLSASENRIRKLEAELLDLRAAASSRTPGVPKDGANVGSSKTKARRRRRLRMRSGPRIVISLWDALHGAVSVKDNVSASINTSDAAHSDSDEIVSIVSSVDDEAWEIISDSEEYLLSYQQAAATVTSESLGRKFDDNLDDKIDCMLKGATVVEGARLPRHSVTSNENDKAYMQLCSCIKRKHPRRRKHVSCSFNLNSLPTLCLGDELVVSCKSNSYPLFEPEACPFLRFGLDLDMFRLAACSRTHATSLTYLSLRIRGLSRLQILAIPYPWLPRPPSLESSNSFPDD